MSRGGSMSGTVKRLSALLRDQDGTVIIEMAFTLPVLIGMFIGCVVVCDELNLKRKVTTATRALADLTTQQSGFTTTNGISSIDPNVFQGAQLILSPYDTTKMSMVVSAISTDALGVTKVTWSRTYVGSDATAGANKGASTENTAANLPLYDGEVLSAANKNWPKALPTAIMQPGTTVVLASTGYKFAPIYNYTPMFGDSFSAPITMSDAIVMGPRISPTITCC